MFMPVTMIIYLCPFVCLTVLLNHPNSWNFAIVLRSHKTTPTATAYANLHLEPSTMHSVADRKHRNMLLQPTYKKSE